MWARLCRGAAVAAADMLLIASAATAVPGSYVYVEDGGCDSHEITLTHELGNPPILGPFPDDEAISSTAFEAGGFDCPGFNLPLLPDFIITITNLTDIEWVDLFFVADDGITVGNKDGTIKSGDAFKIDTVGINTPLLSESIDADLVFDPGEEWTFFVLDWGLPGAFPTPFASIGVGEDSVGISASWASIVANPIPEPASAELIALGLLVLGLGRARRSPR